MFNPLIFDALTSVRPCAPAWPIEKATDLIKEQSGKHFDPELVNAFFQCLPEILDAREKWKEQDGEVA